MSVGCLSSSLRHPFALSLLSLSEYPRKWPTCVNAQRTVHIAQYTSHNALVTTHSSKKLDERKIQVYIEPMDDRDKALLNSSERRGHAITVLDTITEAARTEYREAMVDARADELCQQAYEYTRRKLGHVIARSVPRLPTPRQVARAKREINRLVGRCQRDLTPVEPNEATMTLARERVGCIKPKSAYPPYKPSKRRTGYD